MVTRKVFLRPQRSPSRPKTSLAGWLGGIVIPLGLLAVPVHMFAQMKGAYSLGVFSALWRTTALLVFCNIVIGLFVTAIIYLGLGH